MPTKKPTRSSVDIELTRARKPSESSSKTSHSNAAPSVGRRNSVHFKDGGRRGSQTSTTLDIHPHHHMRRESFGHLLQLPGRRRSYSWQGHPIPVKVVTEPSYQLEPSETPSVSRIKEMIEQEMDDLLHGLSYSILEAPNWTKVLSERLKSETKKILPLNNRYKIITTVVITPKFKQSMQISSRCLWEKESDTMVNSVYQNKDLYVTASVFCVYTP